MRPPPWAHRAAVTLQRHRREVRYHNAKGFKMSTLMQASRQWSSRPADQRFTSLTALNQFTQGIRANSRARALSTRAINLEPLDEDRGSLVARGPGGAPVNVTHWAFGQLCQRASAPAGYLRTLPAAMSADCINYGLRFKNDVQDINILLHLDASEGEPRCELRAVTGRP